MGRIFLTVLALAALALLPAFAVEEPPELEASLRSLVPLPRDEAPMAAELRVIWRGKGLLEGQVVATLSSGGETLARHRGPTLTVGPGSERRQRLVLPVVDTDQLYRQLEVDLRLDTEKGSRPLGRFPLGMEVDTLQPRISLLQIWSGLDRPAQNAVWGLVPGPRNQRSKRAAVRAIGPEDLPARSVALHGVDGIVVEHAALAAMDGARLQALNTWVRRGGRCLLRIDPSAQAPGGVAAEMVAEWERNEGLVGLGRGLVLRAAYADPEPVDAALRGDFWYGIEHNADPARAHHEQAVEQSYGAALVRLLKPTSVSALPLATLGLVLGLFLLAVGPGEWLLLGMVRARRLTWYTFPIIAVVAAGILVIEAGRALGGSDGANRLVLIDVDAEGQVIAGHELHCFFRNRSGTIEAETDGGLLSWYYRSGQGRDLDRQEAPSTDGLIGSQYRLDGYLAKWTFLVLGRRYETFDLPEWAAPQGTPSGVDGWARWSVTADGGKRTQGTWGLLHGDDNGVSRMEVSWHHEESADLEELFTETSAYAYRSTPSGGATLRDLQLPRLRGDQEIQILIAAVGGDRYVIRWHGRQGDFDG
jgi:hypothetical protein